MVYEMAKIRNHFRCTTGEVNCWNFGVRQPIDNPIDRLVRHDLFALRPGVHMAMHASEIAKLTQIYLQNLWARTAERERTCGKCLSESIHYKSAAIAAVATGREIHIIFPLLRREQGIH